MRPRGPVLLAALAALAGGARADGALEAEPDAVAFDGWGVSAIEIGLRDGAPCRLGLHHRPLTAGDDREQASASLTSTACAVDAATETAFVRAGRAQAVTAVATCIDAAGAIAGLRLHTARLGRDGLLPTRRRPTWSLASCARWLRASSCGADQVVFGVASDLDAPLTGALIVHCREVD